MISTQQRDITGAAADSVSISVGGKRVLVVDDDNALLALLKRVITLAGYRVDTANDGIGAWVALGQNPYDLLVTDQNMPGMTGLDLIRKIRGESLPVPCILYSSLLPASDEEIMKVIRHGAVLDKGSNFSSLVSEIVRLLAIAMDESPPERFQAGSYIVSLAPHP